jgi:hypothetical protein
MDWNEVVNRVTPYVVKIETPEGSGTGFLCLYNESRSFCGVATAHHVVKKADEWQQPIRIKHFPSKTDILLKEGDRVILLDPGTDSAVILFTPRHLALPEQPIPLLPTDRVLAIGAEVGWMGFPSIASTTLCFFAGIVSALQRDTHTYLIDGVAIHGVSGGPVVYSTVTDGVQIVGAISAYVGGTTTPGLLYARDVSHFHATITRVRSMDEAAKRIKTKQDEQASLPPSPEPTET